MEYTGFSSVLDYAHWVKRSIFFDIQVTESSWRGWQRPSRDFGMAIRDFGMAINDELPCSNTVGTAGYMTPESLSQGRRTETYVCSLPKTRVCCAILLSVMFPGARPSTSRNSDVNSYRCTVPLHDSGFFLVL